MKTEFRSLGRTLAWALGWGLLAAAPSGMAADPAAAAAVEAEERELTWIPIPIDPQGAPAEVPWLIHMATIHVREIPSDEGSRVLGRLSLGDAVFGTYLVVEETDEEWLEIHFNGEKGYVSRIGLSRIHPKNQELIRLHGNLPIGEEIVNRWWGIPLEYEPNDLVALPPEYTRQVEGRVYRLRREAATSLVEMMDAMRADDLEIYVSSPYRSGESQKAIYRRSASQHGLSQRRSAPPGHSEHQLGTTVDLASTRAGRSLRNTDPQHAWLEENAAKYGWRQTYRADNTGQTGYIEEPWHWRYMGRSDSGEKDR
jgi:hypothetical protein